MNVGSRDNARPSDLVGAIANHGGHRSGEIGKIDMRESHSIVEVAPSVADAVIEKVTGTTIRDDAWSCAATKSARERERAATRAWTRSRETRGERWPPRGDRRTERRSRRPRRTSARRSRGASDASAAERGRRAPDGGARVISDGYFSTDAPVGSK